MNTIRVTIWNEFIHEIKDQAVKAIYPDGIHVTLKNALQILIPRATLQTATQEQPDHGLTDSVLDATDVLVWWGHMGHATVQDVIVDRAHKRVLAGMGVKGHATPPELVAAVCEAGGMGILGCSWLDGDEDVNSHECAYFRVETDRPRRIHPHLAGRGAQAGR